MTSELLLSSSSINQCLVNTIGVLPVELGSYISDYAVETIEQWLERRSSEEAKLQPLTGRSDIIINNLDTSIHLTNRTTETISGPVFQKGRKTGETWTQISIIFDFTIGTKLNTLTPCEIVYDSERWTKVRFHNGYLCNVEPIDLLRTVRGWFPDFSKNAHYIIVIAILAIIKAQLT